MASKTFDIVEGQYLRDILDQPRAMSATLGQLEISGELHKLRDRLREGMFRHVVLTGMGASFHALWPLFLRLTGRGFPALMLETSELVYYVPELLRPESLIVAVSQSGQSGELVRLLDANDQRAAIVGVTNTAKSALAQRSDAVMLTEAGPEFSVSCKTYITAMAELHLLGTLFCGEDLQKMQAGLEQVAPTLEQYLEGWKDRIFEMSAALEGIRQIFLLGRGASLAAVGAGSLILKESVRFPSEGMSSAAFRHGPFEMLGPSTFAAVFAGAHKTKALQEKLLHDVRQAGGKAEWIGEEAGPWMPPQLGDDFRSIAEIIPIQMMTLALAARAGVEAGRFARVSKVTTVE